MRTSLFIWILLLPCAVSGIFSAIPELMLHFEKTDLVLRDKDASDSVMHQTASLAKTISVKLMAIGNDSPRLRHKTMALSLDGSEFGTAQQHMLTLTPRLAGNVALRLDSQVILYEQGDNRVTFDAVYRVKNSTLKRQQLGMWTSSEGIHLVERKQFWLERTDLRNTSITATALDYRPLLFNSEALPGRREAYGRGSRLAGGLFASFLYELQEQLGFDIEWLHPEEGLWGGRDDEGNWKGMMGMLERGSVDLIAAAVTVMEERREVGDFTIPLDSDIASLWVSSSGGQSGNMWVYLEIFLPDASVGIAVMSAILAFGYVVLDRIKDDQGHFMDILQGSVAVIYCSLLQLDSAIQQSKKSKKILWLSTAMLSFVLFSFYTAFLTSFMTIHPAGFKITRFQDVLDYGYKMHVRASSGGQLILENSEPGETLHEIYHGTMLPAGEARIHEAGYDELAEVLRRDPRAVLLLFKYSLFGRDGIEFQVLEDAFRFDNTFMLQKDSEFLEIFNDQLARIMERGVSKHLFERSGVEDVKTSGAVTTYAEATSLGYDNVSFPYLVLAFGLAAAVAVAVAEWVCRRMMIMRFQRRTRRGTTIT